MPTSLVIGALVITWLAVLVPVVARRRQEVAKTADSVLAARVVYCGAVPRKATRSRMKECAMRDTDEAASAAEVLDTQTNDEEGVTVELPLPGETVDAAEPRRGAYDDSHEDSYDYVDDEYADDYADDYVDEGDSYDSYAGEPMEVVHADDLPVQMRRYKPGRGGFDPEAAEIDKQAKYARRRRTVLGMLVAAVATALFAAVAWSAVWWLHALIDIALVGYLTYLRRQVRIEDEIRSRRMARMRRPRVVDDRAGTAGRGDTDDTGIDRGRGPGTEPGGTDDGSGAADDGMDEPARNPVVRAAPTHIAVPGASVVDIDDGDPEFDELSGPESLPYRRAVGE